MAVRKNKRNTIFLKRLPSITGNHNTTRIKKSFSAGLTDNQALLPWREGIKGRGASPQPSPIKGEEELDRVIVFWKWRENILTINGDSVKFSNSAV